MTLLPSPPDSMNSGLAVSGSPIPRLWTPPLRELTEETTYGYEVIDFADLIGWPLDPWQRWSVIHGGELLPDGRPRFRKLLILVARQNGKTVLARVLCLWWMFVQRVPLVIASHAARDKAKESWAKTIEMARSAPELAREVNWRHNPHLQVGEEVWSTLAGSHFRFGASNRRLARGDTAHRVQLDELREHKDFAAWDAAVYAMNAVPDGQAIAITNQGDARSVVLDDLRESALAFIETGQGDPGLGIQEWSAPNGAEVDDPAALAAANPNLGSRIHPDALMGQAIAAKLSGGAKLAGFKTEVLCQRVTLLDPAIDPGAWRDTGYDPDDPELYVDLALHRSRLALCFDVALDGSHATLMAAAVVDDLVYVEVVERWAGFGCTAKLRADLPILVKRLHPRTLGWFPGGPAAAVAAALKAKRRTEAGVWPPPRVVVDLLQAEAPAVCMGLAEQVTTLQLRHPRDPMLDRHVEQSQKLHRGDGWIFVRRGSEPIDGTYATAGAVHLARMLPPPLPPLQVARG